MLCFYFQTKCIGQHRYRLATPSEGLPGEECVLRSICEHAALPLHYEGEGLLAEILHILMKWVCCAPLAPIVAAALLFIRNFEKWIRDRLYAYLCKFSKLIALFLFTGLPVQLMIERWWSPQKQRRTQIENICRQSCWAYKLQKSKFAIGHMPSAWNHLWIE